MPLAMTLIPAIGLLAVILISIIFTSVRSSRLAALKSEHDTLLQRVVSEDAALQELLVSDLLEGQPLAETLQTFERRRAALLPGARLDEPAAWDSETLAQFVRQQFADKAAEANRKLGTTTILATVLLIGVCVVSGAVVYQFLPGADASPAGFAAPAADPFSPRPADSFGSTPAPPVNSAPPTTPPTQPVDSVDGSAK